MQQRQVWADALKGWLMMVVVLSHAIQGAMPVDCWHNHLWNFICSFQMPAFMAVSGYFAYNANRLNYGGGKSKCLRRIQQLLVPYAGWSAIGMTISGNWSIERISQMVMQPDTSYWFLWVLFFISMIFIFCRWLGHKLRLDELIIIGVMCGVLMGVMVVLNFRLFGFQFVSYYFLFYTLGYVLHRFPRLLTQNRLVLCLLFLLWAVLAWSWNMHELPAWMPQIPHVPASLLQYAYRGVTALLAILVIFSLAPKALNDFGRLNRLVSRIGTVSLGYYTCHLLLIGHIVQMARCCLPMANDEAIIAISFVICLCLTFIVVELIKCNKVTARLLLGKLK